MKLKPRPPFLVFAFIASSFFSFAQVSTYDPFQDVTLDPVKVQQFEKFVAWKHGYLLGSSFDAWKSSNTMIYTQEMWYYSESFIVKRDSFASGVVLTESGFDVSRFENKRNTTQKVPIIFDGSKDVIYLLPANQLLYKP